LHRPGRYHQDPLSYEALEHVADFSSETCPGGLVAVAGNTLRVVTIDNLGAMYNQTVIPLRYTPRKLCRLGSRDLVVIEADHNEFNEAERAAVEKRYAAALSGKSGDEAMEIEGVAANEQKNEGEGEGEQEEEEGTVMPVRGPVPGAEGKWASCVRVLDAVTGATKCMLELPADEAAFSVCTCKFTQHSEETFIAVGTAQALTLHPKRWAGCYIHVYRVLGDSLQLLHRTEVEDIPMCLMEFQGRLLAGVGRCLRMYDLGKRKLLKKCENKTFPVAVARLQCSGDRIFVGDLMESVFFVKYRRQENAMVIFADEPATRFVTAMCPVDHSTVAGVDKFGNVFTLRVSDDANEDIEVGNANTLMWEQGAMSGAPNKLENLTHYYLGEDAHLVTQR
jgi:splicing factor 3B subunit 3